MGTAYLFYICPVCFNACEDLEECHQHLMIRCEPGAQVGRHSCDLGKRDITLNLMPIVDHSPAAGCGPAGALERLVRR